MSCSTASISSATNSKGDGPDRPDRFGSDLSFDLNDLVPRNEMDECGTYEFTDIDDWRIDEMIESLAFIRS